MSRPLLLLIDGDSLQSPALAAMLEAEGWDVRWMGRREVVQQLDWGLDPAAVVVDAAASAGAGFEAARRCRDRRPDLPVLVVADAAHGDLKVPMAVQGTLDRAATPEAWGQALRAHKRMGQPLTSRDMFSDLLQAMDEAPSTLPPPPKVDSPFSTVPATKLSDLVGTTMTVDPFAAPPARGAGALPPPPDKVLDTEDIFGDVLADLEGPSSPPPPKPARAEPVSAPVSPPAPAPTPRPAAAVPPIPPAPAPQVPAPAPPPSPPASVAASRAKDEFTLSGISGIHDPFALDPDPSSMGSISFLTTDSGDSAEPTVPKAPEPPPRAPLGASEGFPNSDEPPQGMEEFGNYYLLEKIAVGGMAELFKAKQRGVHNFQKIVAIKRILPHLSDNDEFVTMFIDEAKLAAQLTHPNIVQIFDLGKASNAYYIAMEFVDGRDLRSLLRKVREYHLPLPESIAALVTMKVAGALDYAHRKKGLNDKELKLVHRDISPQNILIGYEGAVKLVDFGIAKAATKNTQTMAGALKGKLLYMSPEQALGQPLDGRSDIYSLGLVLFELLTGERCFQADSELGVLEKVRLGKVADVSVLNPSVSREMSAIVAKALQKNVDHRYSSARLMERDLKELLVKRGNEPTDHDVAEYVHALLKGTKEQVEELLAHKFKAPAAPPPRPVPKPVQAVPAPPVLEDPPTTTAKPRMEELGSLPSFRPSAMATSRPKWLVPVIIGLAVLSLGLVGWALSMGHN